MIPHVLTRIKSWACICVFAVCMYVCMFVCKYVYICDLYIYM
jgi:hypothetical protein